MSIERIESAYAHCMDRKDISGPQMAVLLALGYCANAKTGLCCPSYGYISRLTHLGQETARRAATALREKKLIDWRSGMTEDGNISNTYEFLFGEEKLVSRRRKRIYEPLGRSPVEAPVGVEPAAPLSSERGYPTLTARVPYPQSEGTLPSERGTNTKDKPKINSVGSPVARARTEVKYLSGKSMPDFKASRPTLVAQESRSLVQAAMAACRVTDRDNARVFWSEIFKHKAPDVLECIRTFVSEMRQGEHEGIEKPAAVLMSRLQDLPPKVRPS